MEIDPSRLIIRSLDLSDIPENVPDRPWHKILLETLYGIAGERQKLGWDLPHDLIMIRSSRVSDEIGMGALIDPLPVPGFAEVLREQWADMPAGAIVQGAYAWANTVAMTERVLPGMGNKVGQEVDALLLIAEGWGLFSPDGTSEGLDDALGDGPVADHPDRVEMLMLDMCARGDVRISLTMPRDGVPRHSVALAKDPATYAGAVHGVLVEALQFFMQTIELGHIPAEWKDWHRQWHRA